MVLFIRFRYVLILLLIGLAGIIFYYYKNPRKALNLFVPEIEKVYFVRANIHHDTAHVEFFMIAKNKSPYVLNIDSVYYTARLENVKLISERQYMGLVQQSGERDSVKMLVKIPTEHTMETIEKLQGQAKTDIKFDFTIVYNTWFGKKNWNLTHTLDIEVPVPPRLRIIKTERKKIQLFKKNAKVDLYLEIKNEGKNLDLNIQQLKYSLSLGDELHTSGDFGKEINIQPGSKIVLKFPLDFKMLKPGSTVFKVWTDNDRIPYKLRLNGLLNGLSFEKLPVEIIGSGYTEIEK